MLVFGAVACYMVMMFDDGPYWKRRRAKIQKTIGMFPLALDQDTLRRLFDVRLVR